MGPMSKKARGRQQQAAASRGKGKKGKGGARKPARRAIGAPGAMGGAGFPGGMPGGVPGLPPGQELPDLSKLDFSQFKDQGR